MRPDRCGLAVLIFMLVGCTPVAAPSPTAVPTSARPTRTPPPPATPILTPHAAAVYPGSPLPEARGEFFVGSGLCVPCHQNMTDDSGADVSIDATWRASAEANAGRDPFFLALARSESLADPDRAAALEDLCATCHLPMARTTLAARGEPARLFDGGLLDPEHELNALALDGVSCALCHQIEDASLGYPQSFSGGYVIDLARGPGERPSYGPYSVDPVLAEIMRETSGHLPEQGLHLADSGVCAPCHTLFTPTEALGGPKEGGFPLQATYIEWFYSDYRRLFSCQDCHMPEAVGGVRIATGSEYPRSPFAQHTFVGANLDLLRLLAANAAELGVPASAQELQLAQERTEAFLAGEAATASFQEVRLSGSRLTVDVLIENEAGHKLPSGFPSSRAWLHFTVLDAAGELVFESGGWTPDGRISGNANDADPGEFEQHYLAIVQPEQVQIYEAILRDSSGAVTTGWLSAVGYLKDNRLLPQGYDKLNPIGSIRVWGGAAEDVDFQAGEDQVQYSIDLGNAAGPFTVSVELLYQSIGAAWIDGLRNVQAGEVERFLGFYAALPKAPAVLSSVTQVIGSE